MYVIITDMAGGLCKITREKELAEPAGKKYSVVVSQPSVGSNPECLQIVSLTNPSGTSKRLLSKLE